jgi:diguanylate cyclase (GGDEF)-like protein/PAS domain S-box-containing protein
MQPRPIRVLMLEDVHTDAELCERELKRGPFTPTFQTVDTRDAFDRALDHFNPDVILSDFTLPAFNGMDALDLARAKAPEVPFIFVSGTIGEERAVEALRRGATDYVLKERLRRLVAVVIRAIEEAEQRAARRGAEQELESTRNRLDTIVASLVDVVWSESVSPHQVLYVSAATEAIYQRSPAEFYATPDLWMQVVHPEDYEQVRSAWVKTLAGALFDVEYRIVRPDGQVRWVHDRGTPVCDAHGKVLRIDGLARDVTQRRTQQLKIDRLTRIRDVLTSINAAIVRIRDRQHLFADTCRIAVEHGRFKMAWIGVAQPSGKKVTPVAWHGDDHGYLQEVSESLRFMPEDPGIAARVLHERKPVVINDVAADPRVVFKDAALKRGFRSCVVMPLVVDHEPAGVLTLYSTETGVFDHDEMRLLDDLAGDIGLAMAYIDKEEKLNFLAYYDALTGLCNRAVLVQRLKQEITYAHRRNRRTAVLFIDLDNFKWVNDSLGHSAGDKLLTTVASRLQSAVREEDTVARLGGDEFVMVLADQEPGDNLSSALERILEAVSQPVMVDGREVDLSCSIGVSVYPDDGTDAETLLKNADVAMYRAKELGRNNFQFYEKQMNVRINERLDMQRSLRRALEREEFFLHYQPQLSLHTGELVAAEALARWSDAQFGDVPPDRFIPLAEDSGLIVPLGEWILRRACVQMRQWQDAGVALQRVAVNLSARQLRAPQFSDLVERILRETGLEPRRLELELTESVLMAQADCAISTFHALKAMGVVLTIDDFGTGYSSLSYLKRFPVARLKVDRSFVRDIVTDAYDAAITYGIIALAHSVGLGVVAEGVETAEQLRVLRESGCDEAQGHYFGAAGPAELISEYLRPDTVAAVLSQAG